MITIIMFFGNQYIFRKKHPTVLAVLEVIDRITNQLDKGLTPMNIIGHYLDLSNAFDTRDHEIGLLIHKLQYYGGKWRSITIIQKLFNGKKTICSIQ